MGRRHSWTIAPLVLLASGLAAQEPGIAELHAFLQNGRLAARVHLTGLFSPKIVNTIRSGLPAIVHFDFRLTNASGREVLRSRHSIEVIFDIWAQQYRVTVADTIRLANSFDEMEDLLSRLELPIVTKHSTWDSSSVYRLHLQVTVIPIGAGQSRHLLDRLASSDVPSENSASEFGRSGFSLNLNKLLSFFLGSKERAYGASEWAVSETFRWQGEP